MSEITVRRARRDDTDGIYAVTYASWQDTYADIPDYHRQGIGTRLLEWALETLPRRIDRVTVGVLAANDTARRFYETNGFERIGSTTFEVTGSSFPECIYTRAV